MPSYASEACTNCGQITSPELLTIKRVQFAARSQPAKIVKSRTVLWLCEKCLALDPEWNLPAYKGAPGMTSQALERVRKDQV